MSFPPPPPNVISISLSVLCTLPSPPIIVVQTTPNPQFQGQHPGQHTQANGQHPQFHGPQFPGQHPRFPGQHPQFHGQHPQPNGQHPQPHDQPPRHRAPNSHSTHLHTPSYIVEEVPSDGGNSNRSVPTRSPHRAYNAHGEPLDYVVEEVIIDASSDRSRSAPNRQADTPRAGVRASVETPQAQPRAPPSPKRKKRVKIDDSVLPETTANQPGPLPADQPAPSPSLTQTILHRISSHPSATHIKVEPPITADTCLDILINAPTLRTLSFTLSPHSPSPIVRHRHTFPHTLESLTIHTSTNPKHLFAFLALPALKHLKLDARHAHSDSDSDASLGILQLLANTPRSNPNAGSSTTKCKLTRLTLLDVYPTHTELIQCLRICPSLEKLIVRGTLPAERGSVTHETIRELGAITPTVSPEGADADSYPDSDSNSSSSSNAQPDRGSLALCPQLTHLELSPCACSAADFIGMVQARVERASSVGKAFEVRFAFGEDRRGREVGEVVKRELGRLGEGYPLFGWREERVLVVD